MNPGLRTAFARTLEERATIDLASQRVRAAAVARDRYRHGSAPSLDRELASAMAAYFDLVERYFGRCPDIMSEAS